MRSAGMGDVAALVDLMGEFQAESRYVLDREWAARSFTQLLQHAERGAVWIGFAGADCAGYVVFTTRHSMESGGLDGFVDDMFVRPGHRRRGLATALLDAIFAYCREREVLAVHVEVDPESVAAREVYPRFGFADRGLRLLTANHDIQRL